MEARVRFIIVDQSFVGDGGHHAEYTLCIAEEAAQSADVIVLANKKCPASPPKGIEIRPTFRFPWTQPQRFRTPATFNPTASFQSSSFLADLRRALVSLELSSDDHVFVHSMGFVEIEDLLACMMTSERARLPVFDILLRRDPDELDESASIDRFVAYVKAFAGLGLRRRVRFFADTAELAERYRTLTNTPFTAVGVPFDQKAMHAALAERPRIADDKPVIVGYLGDARPEKGYQFLPSAISKVLKSSKSHQPIHFRVQSNFSMPGGESAEMPRTRKALERLAPAVSLLLEPLDQGAYYRELAAMDIVVLPYLPERYARRSSGIFVQAVAAGKVVVAPRGTTMFAHATRYHLKNCVFYDTPEELPAAIAHAVENYVALRCDAAELHDWCAANSAAAVVRALFHANGGARDRAEQRSPLILHIVDGHCAFNRTGTDAVQRAQLQFLRSAGYRVATLYTVRMCPSDAELPAWIERNYEYWYESGSVFSWLLYFMSPPADGIASLERDLSCTRLFSVPEMLQGAIESGEISAVWMNKVTAEPLLDVLELRGRVPCIMETHDMQAFQYAIENECDVDEDEFRRELSLLDGFEKIISVSGAEALPIMARLGEKRVSVIVPPVTQPALSFDDLGAAEDLVELLTSAGSDAHFVAQLEPLRECGGIDLLFVSSAHEANMQSFDWLLNSIYGPKLAPLGITLLVAGSLSCTEWAAQRQARFPNSVFLAGVVRNLRPLYAAAKIVVLPITQGAGVNVKAVEALSLGKPVVATTLALRGLEEAEKLLSVFDEPGAFTEQIQRLLADVRLRRAEAARNWQIAAPMRDVDAYNKRLEAIFSDVLGKRARAAKAETTSSTWQFVEWGRELGLLNKFTRALLKDPKALPALSSAVDDALRLPGARSVLERLMAKTDSISGNPLVTALLHLSEVASGPAVLAGCRSISDVFRAAGVFISPEDMPTEIDVLVIAQGFSEFTPRAFSEGLLQFYHRCYQPYLAERGVRVAVVGNVERREDMPGLVFLRHAKDISPLLSATRIIVAPWDDAARLHPVTTYTMLQSFAAEKPVVASEAALWFLDKPERACFTAAAPDACVDRILGLLSSQDERLAASRMAARVARQWWKRPLNAVKDLRFNEWGAWLRWCSDLLMKCVDNEPPTHADIDALEKDLNDPAARGAWEQMVTAFFVGCNSAILKCEDIGLLRRMPVIEDLDDFAAKMRCRARDFVTMDSRSILMGRRSGEVEIDLSGRICGSGWYAPEFSAAGCHRWTGPEPRFTLDVFLGPESRRCEMRFFAARAQNFESFSISLDGMAIPYSHELCDDGTIFVAFEVPGIAQPTNSPAVLAFNHRSVCSPSDWGQPDQRKLGLCIRSLIFSASASETETEAALSAAES